MAREVPQPASFRACRIYPLTWHVDGDGLESFGQLEGHPDSTGQLGTSGTVDDYCKAQGLDPYVSMVRRYIAVHDRLLRAAERIAPPNDVARDVALRRKEVDHLEAGALASPLLDVDAVVSAYCKKHEKKVPTDFEALIELHLTALCDWIEELSGAVTDSA